MEGRTIDHFDSGVKPIGSPFPKIDISCAVHGFYCYDSVLVVSAKPVGVTDVPPAPQVRIGLVAAWPNPFAQGIQISYTLDRPGPAELRIVDLAGRRVRGLAAPA